MKTSFSPVSTADARVLILGSFPGEKSLIVQQYYAHPRNVFWKLLSEITGFSEHLEYEERVERLKQKKIALWDVMQSCSRDGSLDSNIVSSTIIANDFSSFFSRHPQIRVIFFNGSRAEKEFRKSVLPWLAQKYRSMELVRLPSTSPAMAMMNYQEKLEAWSVIGNCL